MRYILDTHALLWIRSNDPRLSREKWEERLFDPKTEVLVSIASFWEMSLKRSLGKLEFPGSIASYAHGVQEKLGFELLHIELSHLEQLEALDFHHHDPFDRLIIAQAIQRNAICISRDQQWHNYPVQVEW